MSDIETAEQFARRAEDMNLADTIVAIEARDAAVRLALLDEFKERLQRYYEHARGPAETILSELLAKYSPTSKEASANGD